MKKFLALFLAMTMLCTVTACGNPTADETKTSTTADKISTTTNVEGATENTTDSTVTTSTAIGTEESTSTTEEAQPTESTESTATPTEQTKPTTGKKPATTAKKTTQTTKPTGNSGAHEHDFVLTKTTLQDCAIPWTEYYSCTCGTVQTINHTFATHQWSEWKTTKEPTFEKTGEAARTCATCNKTETKTLDKKSPYYISHEVVSTSRPNAFYIDGVDMLTKMFGENNAFQTGDSIVYKINLSDGGSNGFEIIGTSGCTAAVSGNKVTVKITGEYPTAEWAFTVYDKNGNKKTIEERYKHVVRHSGKLDTINGIMEDLFVEYAEEKYGISGNSELYPEDGYTSNRTPDNDPSITGEHGSGYYGTLDDFFWKADKTNWVKSVLELIGEYKKIGITEVDFTIKDSFFGAIAKK